MEWTKEEQIAALKKLREPFDKSLISKLPKGTKAQNNCPPNEKKSCKICGGWHHPNIIHLDYVGHAAITARLLDVDPLWNWEPVYVNEFGEPHLDKDGGMWIKLTVCGITRLGYGDADGKTGANATKERIGDCLRNSGMRFGMALDLWSKADLTKVVEDPQDEITIDAAYWTDKLDAVTPKNLGTIKTWQAKNKKAIDSMPDGQEKTDTLRYIEDMIKEYTPKKETTGPSEDRTFVDKAIDYMKRDDVLASLDTFIICWDKHIQPTIGRLPANQQKELNDLKTKTEAKFQGGNNA